MAKIKIGKSKEKNKKYKEGLTKNLFGEDSLEFLKKYLGNPSPSGHEREGQRIWAKAIKPYVDEIRADNYGNVIATINPGKDSNVVVEAHSDEIGWCVKYISSEGFIFVEKIGGSDVLVAPGKEVNIHTTNGTVKGVFGCTATHIRRSDYVPKINTIFIDVGVLTSNKVKELGIEIGDPITFSSDVSFLENRVYGRGLDIRIGGFMLIEIAKMIREENIELPYTLNIVNAVQEEVGKNGAKMIAESLKPCVAIVTDVTHDTSTPLISSPSKGDFKVTRGPVLNHSPLIQKTLLEKVKSIAHDNDIKYQKKASNKVTGTDADVFATSNGGIPTCLISLPMRYMHTPVEMVAKQDIKNTTLLMYLTLINIKPDMTFYDLDI